MTTATKTKISQHGKVKLYWNDKPENYSRANRLAVRNAFALKYGVDKDRVKVVYRPVKVDNQGNLIKLDGVQIENVGDTLYQRKLFKEWVERNGKEVNFERLIRLDDKVNAELSVDMVEATNKKWDFEWIMIDNLLSFGDDNFFPIDKFKGLVTVASNPANQGGKTTMIIDAFKFLLYGVTTKTAKNEQIFNRYRDKNTVTVRGLMKIEGEDEFVIERNLTRKEKRDGGWTVTSTLNYYWMLPDDTEETMTEADAVQTTKKILETVGKVEDFDLVSLATGDNLSDLINNTVGENGKIFTRMIGLEILSHKEKIVRKMYNEFSDTMQSNVYSRVELEEEIKEATESLELANGTLIKADEKLNATIKKIDDYEDEKTRLHNSKHVVDSRLTNTNIESLKSQIKSITNDGVKAKDTLAELEKSYNDIDVDYDEYREKRVADRVSELTTEVALKIAECERLSADIKNLENAEICSACERPLDDVDNSSKIKELKGVIQDKIDETSRLNEELKQFKAELESFAGMKAELERKQRLELEIERTNLKLDTLRGQLKAVRDTKTAFEQNLKSIEFNQETDSKINLITSNLQIERHTKDDTIRRIEVIKSEITKYEAQIAMNKTIIAKILKEAEVERIYKLYIEMVGKKGVSKIILRSVIPILNAELDRLLEDVCNFTVEVRIDDKNDVNLIIIKDNVEGLLKSGSGLERTISALALRCVLGLVSTLPMPNFIAFDEVFGKVAQVNIPYLKPLFEKMADSYDKVFLITHNELAKEWANKIITVSNIENISKIDYN